MICNSCSRKTLSLFVQSVSSTELSFVSRSTSSPIIQASGFSSTSTVRQSQRYGGKSINTRSPQDSSQSRPSSYQSRPPQDSYKSRPSQDSYRSRSSQGPDNGSQPRRPFNRESEQPSRPRYSQEPFRSRSAQESYRGAHSEDNRSSFARPRQTRDDIAFEEPGAPIDRPRRSETSEVPEYVPKEKEPWQIQKAALKEKLDGEAWAPRKRLSPDTMEGIRHLNQTMPERFTSSVLAEHFKVSPEAIRRILKSKWKPSDEEAEERLRRWDNRGERIWSNLVEMGVKPPKRWREMGVGRAESGEKPKWKTGSRNSVPIQDSASENFTEEDIIPTVDGRSGQPSTPQWRNTSLSDRL